MEMPATLIFKSSANGSTFEASLALPEGESSTGTVKVDIVYDTVISFTPSDNCYLPNGTLLPANIKANILKSDYPDGLEIFLNNPAKNFKVNFYNTKAEYDAANPIVNP